MTNPVYCKTFWPPRFPLPSLTFRRSSSSTRWETSFMSSPHCGHGEKVILRSKYERSRDPKTKQTYHQSTTQSICNSKSLLLKDSHVHREKLWIHLCCLCFVKWCLQWFCLFATQGYVSQNHDVSTMICKKHQKPPVQQVTPRDLKTTGPWTFLFALLELVINIWFKLFLIPQRFKVRNQPLLQNNNNSSNNIEENYVNN